jgi:cation diffusion facilitator family transporter
MHTTDISRWRHDHRFDSGNAPGERNTWRVVALSVVMMVVEIVAGWWFGSLALLADGWHMSTHVLALGITAVAYAVARRYANDQRFAFGTWKIEVLGGFASAIVLGMVAVLMAVESIERFFHPVDVQYDHALIVACIGLLVNLASAFLLHDFSDHSHDHDHGAGGHHAAAAHHGHSQASDDLNLRAAYIHVLADATTSVLAIVALAGGKYFGWGWLDPSMGLVGGAVVLVWAYGLVCDTSRILLDREMDHPVVDEIREVVEAGAAGEETRVTDLHVWRVGRHVYACALTLVTHDPTLTAERVRARLAVHEEIVHATIEVHLCPEVHAVDAAA